MFLKNFSIAGNKFKILTSTVSFSFLLISKLLRNISLVTILIFASFTILLFVLQLKSSRESHDNVPSAVLWPNKDVSLNSQRRPTTRYAKYKNVLFPLGILLGAIFSYLSFRLFDPYILNSEITLININGEFVSFKGIFLRLPGMIFPIQIYELLSFVIGLIIIIIFFFLFKFIKVVNIGVGYGLGSALNVVLLDPASNDFLSTVVFTTAIFYSISLLLEPKRKWLRILTPVYAFIIYGLVNILPVVLSNNEMKDFKIQENTFEINSLGTSSIYYQSPFNSPPFLRVDATLKIYPPLEEVDYKITIQELDHFDIDVKKAKLPMEFRYHAEGQRKPYKPGKE